jgi:hypothetical protein
VAVFKITKMYKQPNYLSIDKENGIYTTMG